MRFVRIALFWVGSVAVVHGLLRVYLRSLKREALEKAWAEGAGGGDSQEAFMAREMAAFDRSLLLKIVALVYVLPVIVLGTIIYFVNYN